MASIAEHYVHNLTQVPREFLVQGKERPLFQHGVFQELPLVDMSEPPEQIIQKISTACGESWYSSRCGGEYKESSKSFFELPVEEKLKWARDEGKTDQIAGYGRTEGFRGQHTDWMDSLYAFLGPDSLKAPHLWPSTPTNYRLGNSLN
ncbi:flavonol synthase/flavanone 3-hydroxylase-like [Cryptomeria japonica]|uniref:flavonol synthase/flavanone 3-hydroxylase-like n=1 Tax=Cryptomeria japonica TaxID=3369 RepID=UPI0027DA4EC9|nr:flavonol synthase/flavanone 3-hydroxylase-like [Cryptomeria japonica]